MLSQKVSSTSIGIWLLIPELLRLGAWDILKGWTRKADSDLDPRVALQIVNESAMCINRIRSKNSLGHQGFHLANGMGKLISDEQAHLLLNRHTMEQAQEMLVNLGIQRKLLGHYTGDIIAVDPHRIISSSKRVMSKKRKVPSSPSQKMLQTFFCVSAQSGQPIMATMSSTGMPTTRASINLLGSTEKIIRTPSLLVADKEHFTKELFSSVNKNDCFDMLVPMINTNRVTNIIKTLTYKPLWAGFAIAETSFSFQGDYNKYRLIVQRTGELQDNYNYMPFLTTSSRCAKTLICESYDDRWSVEEFFRFENEMGLNRASTQNLNIRYGYLALSMIAQAANYQLRNKLTEDYRKWNAGHLAKEVLAWSDGDIRVENDTIVATLYGTPKHIKQNDYVNLPNILEREGINPKIPWLYNFKLDFRFK